MTMFFCFTGPKVLSPKNPGPKICDSPFYALDLTMEVGQIRVEDGTFQKCIVNK